MLKDGESRWKQGGHLQHVILAIHRRSHVVGPCKPTEGGFRGKRTCHEAGKDRILKIFILASPDGLLEDGESRWK